MPNSYPREGIFNPNLTTIKDSYIPLMDGQMVSLSDRQVWANSVDPDQEQSNQGLHCLPLRLHGLDTLLYSKATLF